MRWAGRLQEGQGHGPYLAAVQGVLVSGQGHKVQRYADRVRLQSDQKAAVDGGADLSQGVCCVCVCVCVCV